MFLLAYQAIMILESETCVPESQKELQIFKERWEVSTHLK